MYSVVKDKWLVSTPVTGLMYSTVRNSYYQCDLYVWCTPLYVAVIINASYWCYVLHCMQQLLSMRVTGVTYSAVEDSYYQRQYCRDVLRCK